MIAVDTSTLIAFLAGEPGDDVEALDRALADREARLPPVVVTEVLSPPDVTTQMVDLLRRLPKLAVIDGFWERSGRTRSKLLSHGMRAAIADTLICQSCLDHDLPLLTRDDDFKSFARHCGLKLADGSP